MKYYSANAVPVTAGYSGVATFPNGGWFDTPMTKLDAFVNGTDVVFQMLLEQTGWTDDQSEEVLMRMGFNSRDPLPPFYAVRFKVWSGTTLPNSGTVDMSCFAV